MQSASVPGGTLATSSVGFSGFCKLSSEDFGRGVFLLLTDMRQANKVALRILDG